MKIRTGLIVVGLVACAAVASTLLWQYYRTSAVELADGRVVEDFSVAELGPFMTKENEPLRRAYLAAGEFYKTLPVRPATGDVAETAAAVELAVGAALRGDERDRAVLAGWPAGAYDKLVRRVALLLERAAGMPLADYEAALGSGATFVVPPNLMPDEFPELEGVASVFAAPGHESAIRKAFAHEYEEFNAANDGDGRLAGWSLDPRGFRAAVQVLSTDAPTGDVLYERVPNDGGEASRFKGDISQGGLIFTAPPGGWPRVAEQHDQVPRFMMSIVVEDRGGDRYPLWLDLYFDPETADWWPAGIYRNVSLKAALKPALAY